MPDKKEPSKVTPLWKAREEREAEKLYLRTSTRFSKSPLLPVDEQERRDYIEWQRANFQEAVDRGYISDQSLSYSTEQLDKRIEEVKAMDSQQWANFVNDGKTEPVCCYKTEKQKVEDYIVQETEKWKKQSQERINDPDFDPVEDKRIFEYSILTLRQMSVGEWREMKQLMASNSKATLSLQEQNEVLENISRIEKERQQQHYENIQKDLEGGNIFSAAIKLNKIGFRKTIGEELTQHLLLEALDKEHIDRITYNTIQKGDIPKSPSPPQP